MAKIARFQVAGMNIHYLYYSLDYFLDSQVAAGIRSIELWGGAPHLWLDYMTYSDCKIVRKKAADRGLDIVVFTPENAIYQYQFAAQEPDQFEKSYRYFVNGIRAAAELGCRIMAINSGWGYLNENRETAWNRSRDMLGRLAEVAGKEGVVLAMETYRPEESRLVVTLGDAKRMIDEVSHPALKAMIDTIAMGVARETLQQWFDVFGKDIVHTHFVDGKPYGHLIWGDGSYPMEDFVTCLNVNDYQGYLGQEITDAKYLENPAAADLKNMEHWNTFID